MSRFRAGASVRQAAAGPGGSNCFGSFATLRATAGSWWTTHRHAVVNVGPHMDVFVLWSVRLKAIVWVVPVAEHAQPGAVAGRVGHHQGAAQPGRQAPQLRGQGAEGCRRCGGVLLGMLQGGMAAALPWRALQRVGMGASERRPAEGAGLPALSPQGFAVPVACLCGRPTCSTCRGTSLCPRTMFKLEK